MNSTEKQKIIFIKKKLDEANSLRDIFYIKKEVKRLTRQYNITKKERA